MSEWNEYFGSEEQIDEIRNAAYGFMCRNDKGECSSRLNYFAGSIALMDKNEFIPNTQSIDIYLKDEGTTQYLICNPHQLANMISQQAKTGQPVYFKIECAEDGVIPSGIMRAGDELVSVQDNYFVVKTDKPDWYMSGLLEASFTPFEDK